MGRNTAKQSLLILSRGHGFGHAAKDLQVVRSLHNIQPNLSVRIASSGLGLQFYGMHSVPCVDLKIADDDDDSREAERQVYRMLYHLAKEGEAPSLVVSDEVFSSPHACRILGIHNILMSDWLFSDVGLPEKDSIFKVADYSLILDFAEAHSRTFVDQTKMRFVGPLARQFQVGRREARKRLGIHNDQTVVVITFGSLQTHKVDDIRAMLSLSFEALEEIQRSARQLTIKILGGDDLAPFGLKFDYQSLDIDWLGFSADPAFLFRAADVVIAYATFTTMSDLVRNDISTVAFTGTSNPIDLHHAAFYESIGGLTHLKIVSANPELVCQAIASKLWSNGSSVDNSHLEWATPDSVAFAILRQLSAH